MDGWTIIIITSEWQCSRSDFEFMVRTVRTEIRAHFHCSIFITFHDAYDSVGLWRRKTLAKYFISLFALKKISDSFRSRRTRFVNSKSFVLARPRNFLDTLNHIDAGTANNTLNFAVDACTPEKIAQVFYSIPPLSLFINYTMAVARCAHDEYYSIVSTATNNHNHSNNMS